MFNRISINDTANGPGIRVVVWFQGCPHHCRGCHNPQTWNPNQGKPLSQEVIDKVLDALDKPYVRGLTLSGGDPLSATNIIEANSLTDQFRKRFSYTKDLWIWTGYLFEEFTWDENGGIDSHPCVQKADVVVDGKFDITKKDISLPYSGSSNQRVINMRESFYQNRVVLWQEDCLNIPKKNLLQRCLSGVQKVQQAMISMLWKKR